jgi:predicted RNA-binding Zn ribbon-like protein
MYRDTIHRSKEPMMKEADSRTRTVSDSASSGGTSSPARFGFIGGDPSIDFVNTVDDRLAESPSDRLASYDDLLDWCEQAGLVRSEVLASLRRAASEREQDTARALRRARSFRERLYRILAATAAGDPPDGKDLDAITASARKAAARSRLERRDGGFAWILDEVKGRELDRPIWELARAAVALLTSESLQRVRQCADETCGWLFIDRSRNRSRRWCDMSSCGNRAKARRNYARKKARRAAREA